MLRSRVLLWLVVLSACASPASSAGSVQIRVANESAVSFGRVIVGFPTQEEDYGAVTAGSRSSYREIEQAYRYAYIEVHVNDEKLVLQPIDYVGESLLAPGRYTYALDVDASLSGLSLLLRQDQ